MSGESPTQRWIFRDGRSCARGETVRAGLAAALARLRQPTRERLVDALIRAGELETALADAGGDDARLVADITQSIAVTMVGGSAANLDGLAAVAEQMRVPETIELSVPEGFAYYALHPLAYADIVEAAALRPRRAAVVGIRSIGATLSAVVTAALARRHIKADRITVRPVGHPFDRKTHFTAAQLRWIAAARHEEAEFLVVDEGPGLSGSSFLSVGEALLSAGVERRRIRFLCSWEADPNALRSPGGAERWRGFQSHAARTHQPDVEGLIDVSAGEWRRIFPTQRDRESAPPTTQIASMMVPSWVQMERAKFLTRDGRRLFKFAGLGRFGEEVGNRAAALAVSGFGPRYFGVRDGYAEYGMLDGRPARVQDLSSAVIERIAEYCAWRAAEFRASSAGESSLEAMARYNYEQEFGEPAPECLALPASANSVLCDGHMQPHEWIIAPDGVARKTDGDTHGDDHFFPGPADIAWDLAGAIVEWEMDRHGEEYLLRRFAARHGEGCPSKIEPYVLAYTACRIAFCRMGAVAMAGNAEQSALLEAADRYRRFLFRRQMDARPRHQRDLGSAHQTTSVESSPLV